MNVQEATLKFYQCNQKPWQSNDEYASELKTVWREMRAILKEVDPGYPNMEATLGKHHEIVPRFIDGLLDPEHKRQALDWYNQAERKSGRHPRFSHAVIMACQVELIQAMVNHFNGP